MSEQNGTGKPRGKSRKWPITVAVVAVVAAVAGGGFWVWHEQPSFCNAICHTPMDPYLAAFEQEPGVQGVDKWGNTVEKHRFHVGRGSCSAEGGRRC